MPSTSTCTDLGPLVDHVLPHHQDAGHVVRPVLARVEEHAAEAAHLRLRRERLAHREGVDRALAASAPATSGGAISTILMSLAVMPFCFMRAEHDQPLVGEAAGDGDRLARADRRSVWIGPSFCTTTALP